MNINILEFKNTFKTDLEPVIYCMEAYKNKGIVEYDGKEVNLFDDEYEWLYNLFCDYQSQIAH